MALQRPLAILTDRRTSARGSLWRFTRPIKMRGGWDQVSQGGHHIGLVVCSVMKGRLEDFKTCLSGGT